MDKVAVQMFAAPIERTPKNIVSLAILVSLATRKRRREGKTRGKMRSRGWMTDPRQLSIFPSTSSGLFLTE